MNRMGDYDHLDNNNPLQIEIPMAELAAIVDRMNYGAHRFLSAWVRVRQQRKPGDPLAGVVRRALDQGLY